MRLGGFSLLPRSGDPIKETIDTPAITPVGGVVGSTKQTIIKAGTTLIPAAAGFLAGRFFGGGGSQEQQQEAAQDQSQTTNTISTQNTRSFQFDFSPVTTTTTEKNYYRTEKNITQILQDATGYIGGDSSDTTMGGAEVSPTSSTTQGVSPVQYIPIAPQQQAQQDQGQSATQSDGLIMLLIGAAAVWFLSRK